jgi:hypothetical protein
MSNFLADEVDKNERVEFKAKMIDRPTPTFGAIPATERTIPLAPIPNIVFISAILDRNWLKFSVILGMKWCNCITHLWNGRFYLYQGFAETSFTAVNIFSSQTYPIRGHFPILLQI